MVIAGAVRARTPSRKTSMAKRKRSSLVAGDHLRGVAVNSGKRSVGSAAKVSWIRRSPRRSSGRCGRRAARRPHWRRRSPTAPGCRRSRRRLERRSRRRAGSPTGSRSGSTASVVGGSTSVIAAIPGCATSAWSMRANSPCNCSRQRAGSGTSSSIVAVTRSSIAWQEPLAAGDVDVERRGTGVQGGGDPAHRDRLEAFRGRIASAASTIACSLSGGLAGRSRVERRSGSGRCRIIDPNRT